MPPEQDQCPCLIAADVYLQPSLPLSPVQRQDLMARQLL